MSVKRAEAKTGVVAARIVFKRLPKATYALYDINTRELVFSKIDIQHVLRMLFDDAHWKKVRRTRQRLHVAASTEGLVFHEFGHALDHSNDDSVSRAIRFLSDAKQQSLSRLSGATRHGLEVGNHEAAAEVIVAVLLDSELLQYVPEEIIKEVKRLLP